MKVGFENAVAYYSGKYDEVVYQEWLKGKLCFARRYAYPNPSTATENMKEIASNLSQVYDLADPLYVGDLKAYSKKNFSQNMSRVKAKMHKMASSKALFISCMWQWYQSDPTHIDLKTITIADIVTMDSPLVTVKKCVEAGYLKRVTGYEVYNHAIDSLV